MKICENCGIEHEGNYGSGRFCSYHCRQAFAAKRVKNNNSPFKCGHSFGAKAKLGGWKCEFCEKTLRTRKELFEHRKLAHKDILPGRGWAKGLTKETSNSVAKMANGLKQSYKTGKIKCVWKDKHLPEDIKEKIRNGQIKYLSNKYIDRFPRFNEKSISVLDKISKENRMEFAAC